MAFVSKIVARLINLKRSLVILFSVSILSVALVSVARATNSAPTTGVGSLTYAIDTILMDPRLDGAQADVVVRSAKTGEVLYSRNADNRLIPASNEKLYTSLSAMEALGPDYRFTTTVATDGKQVASALLGNLYLKGTGDPTLQVSDYDNLAASVAAKGIRTITGKLVADDTFFDHRQLGNNWAWDNSPFYFQPEISALTVAADPYFDIGSLTVVTKAGTSIGSPAQVTTDPTTDFVHIINRAITGAAGSPNTISVERELGVNKIDVTGSMPIDGGTETDLSTVSDTTGYAVSVFRDALTRHGIHILGNIARNSTPSTAAIIRTRQSVPLSQLFIPFLKLSNNGIAEILVKTMGQKIQQQGTWDAGLTAINGKISHLGVDTNTLQIVDGSGLSNLDFISSQQTTNLLIAAQKEPWFTTWYNALPIAGEPDPLVGGTLRSRMVGTKATGNVHGKTGSLVGVSALSGYVTDADGELLVFSIMENNYVAPYVKDIEDAIAIDLANFSRTTGVSQTAHAQMNTKVAPIHLPTDKRKGWECSWTKEGC